MVTMFIKSEMILSSMYVESDFDEEFKLSMPGLFNVSNALCAIAIARLYDIPVSDIQAGLYQAKVPGRMEIYTSNDQKITAIVDYAHNQLSFQKLFESVRNEYPGYRATIIFGCPGKKAQDRRHDLGEIAGKYADYIYLTEEDAGEEDPLAIAEELQEQLKKKRHHTKSLSTENKPLHELWKTLQMRKVIQLS